MSGLDVVGGAARDGKELLSKLPDPLACSVLDAVLFCVGVLRDCVLLTSLCLLTAIRCWQAMSGESALSAAIRTAQAPDLDAGAPSTPTLPETLE
eukprot:1109432-Rhodomonas_salina.3